MHTTSKSQFFTVSFSLQCPSLFNVSIPLQSFIHMGSLRIIIIMRHLNIGSANISMERAKNSIFILGEKKSPMKWHWREAAIIINSEFPSALLCSVLKRRLKEGGEPKDGASQFFACYVALNCSGRIVWLHFYHLANLVSDLIT